MTRCKRLVGKFFVGGKRTYGMAKFRKITLLSGLLRDVLEAADQLMTGRAGVGFFLNQFFVEARGPLQTAHQEFLARTVVACFVGNVEAAAEQGLHKGRVL